MLAVTHTVKECSKSTKVLSATAAIQQVRVKTLKLIHDCADILDAVCKLYAHSLFYYTNKRMTMHHGREIVKTVCQSKCLWVCVILAHLLNTTVNISEVWIDALNGLAINNCLKTKHTVG
jgi:hypothetical protein